MNPLYNDDDDDDNDLVKALLLESIITPKCENENQFENTLEINNCELTNNSEVLVKDELSILPEKCKSEDNFIQYDIENCNNVLNLNKQVVSSLLNLKMHITSALQRCEQKLAAVERSLEKHTVRETKILICNAGIPYFKDRQFFFAPNNEDETLKENRKELQLRNLPKVSSWTKTDRDMLLKVIQKEAATNGLSTRKVEPRELNNATFKLKKERKSKRKKEVKTESLPTNFAQTIGPVQKNEFDWFKISSAHFEDTHSPLDCSVMWNVFLRPNVNKNYWTKSENVKLKEIVEKYKFQNWDTIAKELGTNRSAYQCFIRYNTTKNLPKIKNCTWTKEEDKKLLRLIEIFQIGDFIPWGEVASWMRNRTKQQSYFRWTYSLSPYLIKGRFTRIEDNILMDAVTKYGRNFCKISAVLMPNRSTIQLHDRYQTLTFNQIENWNLWTLEDDTKLLDLFKRIGRNWSAIAKEFSYKSRTQLRHRHTALKKYIKRGISLFELHKNEFHENKKDKQISYKDIFRSNSNVINEDRDDNNTDKKLIEYFRTKYKIKRFIHKWKFYSIEKLKCKTTNLYNTLQVLNAELCIPDDISDIKLSDEDRQLSYSLVEYIKRKNDKKLYSQIVDKYKLRMFHTEKTKEEGLRFVPPPPFNSQIKLKKSKESQCIDYDLNIKNNFLLEETIDFDTPDLVISCIGGKEQELQFQKISNLFKIHDSKDKRSLNIQNCSKFSRNNSSDRMLQKIEPIARSGIVNATSFENGNNDDCRHIKLQSKYRKKSCTQIIKQGGTLFNNFEEKHFSSTSGTEITREHDIPVIYATHSTLLSLKNLIYLKRLNEKYSTPSQLFIESNRFEKEINLLETRLEQLLKYPIGLSKTVLPEVHVIDTFSSNDMPKRKKFETSDVFEMHEKKKLRTLSKDTKSLRW